MEKKNSKKKEEQTVKYKYIFSEDFNPTYVNGAYGGISPQGEIVLHFYLERQGLPISQTQVIKNSELGEIVGTIPEDLNTSFIRFINTGIILNLDVAKNIQEFLSKQIHNLEKFKKEIKPGKKKKGK